MLIRLHRRSRWTVIATALVAAAASASARQPASFDTLMAAYRHADAAALARRQLADLEAQGLGHTPAAAAAIENLLRVFIRQYWGLDEAADLMARARHIREASGDPESLVQTLVLNVQVLEMLDTDPAVRLEVAEQALALAQRLWPDGDMRVLEVEHWRGMALYRNTKLEAAIELLTRVAAQQEHVVPDSLALARTFHTLALVHSMLRNFAQAVDAAEKALAIRDRLGDELAVSYSANFLSRQYAEAGDYSRAHAMTKRSIEIRTRLLGEDFPLIGEAHLGLAQMHELMGDVGAATTHYERAMWLQRRTAGEAITAARYAAMLTEQRDLAGAKPLFERALSIATQRPLSQAALGMIHGNYADWLFASGRNGEARAHAEIAHGVRDRAKLPLGLGASLAQLGRIAAAEGDDQSARRFYERALDVHQRVWRDHPHTNITRSEYAGVLARLGDFERARTVALESTDVGLSLIRLALRGLPEAQAVTYATALRRDLELLLALFERSPDASFSRLVFDRVIRSRALVLDEIGRRHQGAPPAAAATLAAARERLARLTVRGADGVGPDTFAALMASARADADRAEETLAAASPQARHARDDERVGLDAVERLLEPGMALVAFVQYAGLAAKPGAVSASRYGAFVRSADRPDPVFVPLGPAAPIDSAVAATRDELLREANAGGRGGRRTLTSYRRTAAVLRELVWDPLREPTRGATNVMLVPDGALHLVSFAALPTGESRYLLESGPTLHYLAAERDLSRPSTPRGDGLLALGGPQFDASLIPSTAAATRSVADLRAGCGNLSRLRFNPLPASASEARTVASLWNRSGGTGAGLLVDAAASETTFKQRAPGHRVLHLATHGFFGGVQDCDPPTTATIAAAVGTAPAMGDALLRSGLALAGANERETGGSADDGMLMAAEIASLDLSSVEWAVLSACDTGLGSIANGEGVFGLRRAFRIAGAATTIMTLWPVDDEATRDWVGRLYTARLVGRQSTAEAMRTASRHAIDARRRAGASDHPFYWGGFVAAGDWR